ncbi:hypothetical protein M1446_04225 [Candidatus Dependentiae bacterium]|nr:hypothetical protein [Candidatus Dependentiae bacterium]
MLSKQKKFFSVIFLGTQICFLFFYIAKQSKIIELTYDVQKLEKKKETLLHQFDNLKQDFFKLKKYHEIKNQLIENYNFEKVKMEQIKNYEHELNPKN